MARFYSTNDPTLDVSFREAVTTGMTESQGLFMPRMFPQVSNGLLKQLSSLSFPDLALQLSKLWLGDELSEQVIAEIVRSAFTFPVPLVAVSERLVVLELFHGPTLSFKDFGARFLAQYLSRVVDEKITVLVATSGDTGSAVAAAFSDIPNARVVILYPSGGVSFVQEQQLTTLGPNVSALEVLGTFDDCQRLVKSAFVDRELTKKMSFTSANSINIARLIPQSFYYFAAVAQLPKPSDPIVFSVPSGNFGNITAGLFAQRMGLPISKFIAAVNANDVVCRYLQSGEFQAQSSKATLSNAMDVGNPSNFSRILSLFEGNYARVRESLCSFSVSDSETEREIERVSHDLNYTLDPHGAVGTAALKRYQSSNPCVGVVLETAHPAKFSETIERVLKKPVEMPERLAQCLSQPRRSQKLAADYSSFQRYLLETLAAK